MSLYAVKNDEGKWLRTDTFGTCYWKDEIYDAERYIEVLNAHHDAKRYDGHVVELVEAPAKVAVREEEAEMLEQAKCDDDPAELIVGFVNSHDKYDDDRKAEDRLMRAYVIGWTVEKPKRWNVKVPIVQAQGGLWFYINSDDDLDATYLQELAKKFTMDEIEENELQDCEKVECDNDD